MAAVDVVAEEFGLSHAFPCSDDGSSGTSGMVNGVSQPWLLELQL